MYETLNSTLVTNCVRVSASSEVVIVTGYDVVMVEAGSTVVSVAVSVNGRIVDVAVM